MKHPLLISAMLALATALHAQQPAQQPMGTINTADAQVSGGLEVSGEHARLLSNASITAYDHTAQIDLSRGGLVSVCATSAFHLLRSGTGDALLFALDRGAMEIRIAAQSQDAILTPDLRFTMLTPGTLDLRMRVTRDGDTCVDNRGDTAPVLKITEGFGDATYHLAPNQHVLFEHGSLRDVVDRERSDCGCPQSTPTMVATSNPNATSVETPQQASAQQPFPVAQSADLAPITPSVPLPAAGNAQTIVLSNNAAKPPPIPTSPPVQVQTAPPPTEHSSAIAAALSTRSAEPPPSPPGARDIFHKIGHFFKRLFGGKPQAPEPTR
ncbi:MAG TPA: nuclease [Acidobacteriaceae bacterium]|nr:nuclease [Acidobacteriaceae bacterium]